MGKPASALTQLLVDYSEGDEKALSQLLPLVEKELHRLAAGYLRKERAGHTLQPTALVNEAFLSLLKQPDIQWQSRAHFYAVAALAMRQVLVGHARKHRAAKRGGGLAPLSLDDDRIEAGGKEAELVALDDALRALAQENGRQAKIVELRYFGGMTVEEVGQVLSISPRTVKREWMVAKAWLYQQLSDDKNAKP